MSRARDLADSADKDIAGTLTVDAITASGTIAANSYTGDGSSLTGINTDLVADTTPQLGGNLDTNGNDITFGDNDKAIFGASSDLQIYHDGQSRIKDAGSGHLILMADADVRITDSTGNETKASFVTDGAVNLSHNGNTKFSTTSTGIDVTGNIIVSGTVDGRDVATDGSKLDGIESGATADQTASEILTLIKTVDGSGSGLDADTLDGLQASQFVRLDVGQTKTAGGLTFNDNLTLSFGTHADLEIYHNGTNSIISEVGAGDLIVYTNGAAFQVDSNTGENMIYAAKDAGVNLYHNNNVRIQSTNAGATITGTVSVTGDITISGAGTLRDVTGEYGSIEVDGGATNNWEGYSIGGQVVFMTDGNAAGIYNDYNNQWMIRAELNGETALRHAGSQKLATTSSGISVTGNISLTDVLLLDQNASNHSSTTEGALYYNTTDDAVRVYAGGKWNNLSMLPAVTPAALNFMNHNYTRSSYTGQDGYTRTYGKLTSPTQSYAGNTFATAFDGASNHVLVLRFLASSAAYLGLGVSIASSITDAQADNNPGSSYYGLGGDWTGASGVTHYGAYFNSSSTVPTHTTTDGYLYIYTEGSGASRTLQMKFSAVYSSDFLNTGTELQGGNDSPSGGTKITQSILPITIGTKDFALAIGEASDTYEWRIERYGTY